jgi:hypothetical protein
MKWLAAMAVLVWPAASLAEDQPSAPDTVIAPPVTTPRPVSRPWLYSDDATIPAPLHAVVQMRGTYTSAGDRSVTRPFASNVSARGGLAEIGGVVGLLPLLSIEATGVMGFGDGLSGGMVGGLRFAPLAMTRSGFRLVIGGGYLRDRSADNGVYGRVAASYDVGRLRVATMAHGEHVFGVGRDALDLLVTAGASVRVVGPVRAGVEYVGQDLEELGADAAEGGARHFVGPVLSFDMLDHKLMFAGGPAAGLSYSSPRVVGRLSLAYAF